MWKLFIWLRNLAAVLGGLWLVVTCTPLVDWWARGLARPWGNCEGDVLVVLGGSVLGDDLLGVSSYWRAVYTVREIRKHPFRQVIISGGNGDGGKPSAELMREFVAAHGIDTEGFAIEAGSLSTRENAVNSAGLLASGPHGKVVLLTSDFHVYRAMRAFRRASVEAEPCPVPDLIKRYGNWPSRAGLFAELVTESAKIGWYRWKGWI